jgi:two-component system cell cycle sensor histidine kinase/response regulator CckA
MGGPELVERLREQDPDVRVVLISGYAREELPSGLDELGVPFLAKPFEVPELLRVVREALDG